MIEQPSPNIGSFSHRRAVLQTFALSLQGWLPSRGNVIFTLLVVGAVLWAQQAGAITLGAPVTSATSATTMAYQGRLADASGAPLTGTHEMVFRLYNAPSGGTPLWEEQWAGSNAVQVTDGLFNVMLGRLTTIPSSIVNDADLYLGVAVGSDPEMIPRMQLGSAPFAMQALTVPDDSIGTSKLRNAAVVNEKLALQVHTLAGVPDQFRLTTTEQTLAQTTITVPYDALYLAFIMFEADGLGARSIAYLRAGSNGPYFGGLNHTSNNVLTTSALFSFELPAGEHVLALRARTTHGSIQPVVRSGTRVIIIPVAQLPR
ncbi:MAG: hypothetical protein DCC55_31685 [Chloroflexi bacterium]|nr:MAG: hypothetical protein DCC55_31685 [Chloroflexota bacterium]